MYIVAGILTILWSIVIYFLMPPDPIRAKGFDERERYIAVARLRVNNSGVRNTHFKKEQLFDLLTDMKFYLVFSSSFLMMICNGPVSTFTPIIISSFGFNTLNSLLLTMPAGAIIGTIEWVAPYVAYKVPNMRAYLVVACEMGSLLASLLLWLLPRDNTGGLLFGIYILASFGGAYAVLMGMQIANTAGYTKRSLASSGMFVGYCLGKIRTLTSICGSRSRRHTSSRAIHQNLATAADLPFGREFRGAIVIQTRRRSTICSWIYRCCRHVGSVGSIGSYLPHGVRMGE